MNWDDWDQRYPAHCSAAAQDYRRLNHHPGRVGLAALGRVDPVDPDRADPDRVDLVALGLAVLVGLAAPVALGLVGLADLADRVDRPVRSVDEQLGCYSRLAERLAG